MKIDYDTNGKVNKLVYNNGKIEIEIEPFVSTVTNFSYDKNIGNILECYRQKITLNNESANQYLSETSQYIDNFFNSIKLPNHNFIPDYVMSFYLRDPNLQEIVKRFIKKLKIDLQFDYSSACYKKDNTKPITDLSDNDENFVYNKPENLDQIQKLILIDDSIADGRTLNHFLNKLSEYGLISNKTKVRFFCIYNNPKRSPKMLNEIGKILKEMEKK